MQTLSLPGTGRITTRVGFGCSGLLGGAGARQSMRLLETAYAAGIRHFDVAPMYGYGTAEPLLGSFLRRHADATVTTKYGLLPERRSNAEILLRSVAKGILARLRRPAPRMGVAAPAARAIFKPTAIPTHASAPPPNKAPFTAAAAETSLHNSLRALQRDSVDLFLLHEASASDLREDRLLLFLERAVDAGKIGAFGVGSPQELLPELIGSQPAYCGVVQSEWNVWDLPLPISNSFRVAHRVLQRAAELQQWVQCETSVAQDWSNYVGADLQDKTVWPGLLLQVALTVNPEALLLFSSRSSVRIQSNADAASSSSLAQAGLRLHSKLLSELQHVSDSGFYSR